ncbi:hypothetical protein [Burkholderia multivorans]|uniref:hypothetical protein n=1 Tax=Burkholderia multivorans TaxID=87883 RepID=UPI000CFEC94F|nr:hypothetical protein [Burkholderia multivorans]MBY4794583.1 hypothetical protein [Burkholderia multivorans]PRE60515.1 hypothetical protein C6P86_22870 [Burkholderia multivorans]PRE90715.1 hypothetical protein C6Q00_02890 [Burkholderia multivorans]PRG25287.1 hypothetical protein C6T57_08260 [Burkholderia multivorans]HEF4771635.1 hypothetical protein [Burkholderia multivorans]
MNQTNVIGIRNSNIDVAEAYKEGAFFADVDWQAARKDTPVPFRAMPVAPGYSSMADHCEAAWDFIRRHVCPEWDHADVKGAFFVGYEDRATELANAGEAGYETLAEAGTVADTEGWVLQSEPWEDEADADHKRMRALRALQLGATAWRTRAAASGAARDRYRAEEAEASAKSVIGDVLAARCFRE